MNQLKTKANWCRPSDKTTTETENDDTEIKMTATTVRETKYKGNVKLCRDDEGDMMSTQPRHEAKTMA